MPSLATEATMPTNEKERVSGISFCEDICQLASCPKGVKSNAAQEGEPAAVAELLHSDWKCNLGRACDYVCRPGNPQRQVKAVFQVSFQNVGPPVVPSWLKPSSYPLSQPLSSNGIRKQCAHNEKGCLN